MDDLFNKWSNNVSEKCKWTWHERKFSSWDSDSVKCQIMSDLVTITIFMQLFIQQKYDISHKLLQTMFSQDTVHVL